MRVAGWLVLVALCGSTPASACLWDRDTLVQERARFPAALELMTGRFARHSPAFYEWRVRDRQAKLAADPDNLRLLDDLCVALSKLERHDEAIAAAQRALALDANRYETHANLGTLLIHAGKLADGLRHIDRAIEINPDAHFGRERWQKYFVEYALRRAAKPDDSPLWLGPIEGRYDVRSEFLDFLAARSREVEGKPTLDVAGALKGLLGIMRFGSWDHPFVLEALAHLLMAGSASSGANLASDARQLAARAMLRAAELADREQAATQYRVIAREFLSPHEHLQLADVEAQLKRELAEARAWYATLEADELAWIAAGKDVDAEFEAKYWSIEPAPAPVLPESGAPGTTTATTPGSTMPVDPLWLVAIGVMLLAVGIAVTLRTRRA